MMRHDRLSRMIRFTLLLAGLVVVLFPLLWMVATSLKPEREVFTLSLLPSKVMWQNYRDAWRAAPFGRFFINTATIALTGTVLSVYLNAMAGFAFSTYRFRYKDGLFLAYLATMMIPGQVTMMPVFLLIKSLGWVNTYAGVIVPGLASAFGTFLLRQNMRAIPKELYEAARLDGCSELGLFHRIALPLTRPSLAALAIFVFVGEWNQFLWPLIVLNKPAMFTVQIGLQRFVSQYDVNYSHLMAMSVVSLLPIAVVFALFQRQLIQGIAHSGVNN
jgi:multiple sugar transport system permease protein